MTTISVASQPTAQRSIKPFGDVVNDFMAQNPQTYKDTVDLTGHSTLNQGVHLVGRLAGRAAGTWFGAAAGALHRPFEEMQQDGGLKSFGKFMLTLAGGTALGIGLASCGGFVGLVGAAIGVPVGALAIRALTSGIEGAKELVKDTFGGARAAGTMGDRLGDRFASWAMREEPAPQSKP